MKTLKFADKNEGICNKLNTYLYIYFTYTRTELAF